MKNKLQKYDYKGNKFIEYVRDEFINSFKNDEEIRDNMRVILWMYDFWSLTNQVLGNCQKV